MKYCQTCGKEIHDNAEICPYCGCRVTQLETAGLAVAALVLTFIMPLIGFILGCVGVAQYKNKTYRSMCKFASIFPIAIIIITVIISVILGALT